MAVPWEQTLHAAAPESSFLDRSAFSSAPPSELEIIVVEALQTRASGAAIVLEKNGTFVCEASVGPSAPPVGSMLEVGNGLSGLCLKTGTVLMCRDAEDDSLVNREACRSLSIRSVVTVPVICNGRTCGLLEVFSPEANAFDDHDVALLRDLAQAIVSTIRSPEVIPGVEEVSEAEMPDAIPSPSLDAPELDAPEFVLVDNGPRNRNTVLWTTLLLAAILIPTGITIQRRFSKSDHPATSVRDVPNQSSQDAGVDRPPSADSAYALATSFAEGRGAKQDPVEAYAWYVIAARDGNKGAEEAIKKLTPSMPEGSIARVRFRLGQIFESGDRTPVDLEAAYFWFSLSENAGHSRASAQKEKVGRLLSKDERQQSDLRVAKWLKQHSASKSQAAPGTPGGGSTATTY